MSNGDTETRRGRSFPQMMSPPTATTRTSLNLYHNKLSSTNGPTQTFHTAAETLTSDISRALSLVNEALVEQRKTVTKLKRLSKEAGNEENAEALATRLADAEKILEQLVDGAEAVIRDGEDTVRQATEKSEAWDTWTKGVQKGIEKIDNDVIERSAAAMERKAEREAAKDQDGDVDEDVLADLARREEEERTNFVSVKRAITESVREISESNSQLSPADQYGQNNMYAGFRRAVHLSLFTEQDPIPPRHKWFASDGSAVLPSRAVLLGEASAADGAGGGDSDDELVIQRVKLDYKCPLTFQEFRNPVTTSACRHSYEKEAMEDYLAGERGQAKTCPALGCGALIKLSALRTDEEMVAILERRRKRREQGEDDEDEEAEGSGEEDDGEDVDDILPHGTKKDDEMDIDEN